MDEINKTNLSEQTKFRLSEIIGIENYFHQEINQRKSCSKKLSKYVTAYDYIDKIDWQASQALFDMEISHEEFNTIIREKQKYQRMKENVRNVSEKQENMRLNSVN